MLKIETCQTAWMRKYRLQQTDMNCRETIKITAKTLFENTRHLFVLFFFLSLCGQIEFSWHVVRSKTNLLPISTASIKGLKRFFFNIYLYEKT